MKDAKEHIAFSVDDVQVFDHKSGLFVATIIRDDSNSEYFAPQSLQYFYLKGELLTEELYSSLVKKYTDEYHVTRELRFLGTVKPGAYYRMPSKLFRRDFVYTPENDVFGGHMMTSPYLASERDRTGVIELEDAAQLLNACGRDKLPYLYVYGLDVKQGDTILVICPTGNAYLIDSNLYNAKGMSVRRSLDLLQTLLVVHGVPEHKLRALIITHKHVDHLRGAHRVIERFRPELLLMNFDYSHPTKAVETFLNSAKSINRRVNINDCFRFRDGNVTFEVFNPTPLTRDKAGAPDVNDSSIGITLNYGYDKVCLTGDMGSNILLQHAPQNRCSDLLLKVSHHGSRSGTNHSVVKHLRPSHAFVSAGYHKRYKHPHREVVTILTNYSPLRSLRISKYQRGLTGYLVTGEGIQSITSHFGQAIERIAAGRIF